MGLSNLFWQALALKSKSVTKIRSMRKTKHALEDVKSACSSAALLACEFRAHADAAEPLRLIVGRQGEEGRLVSSKGPLEDGGQHPVLVDGRLRAAVLQAGARRRLEHEGRGAMGGHRDGPGGRSLPEGRRRKC